MIPKKIHYCWFGRGKKTEEIERYLSGWRRLMPDYEIIEWNEDNFDINGNCYVKEAYEARKWAFVTDYARLKVLADEGGIYMDTDVEVLKNLDQFLGEHGFSGFEAKDMVPTGIMAAEKGNVVIKELLKEYDNRHFLGKDGKPDLTTNVVAITSYFVKHGLKPNGRKQTINGFTMYPQRYFCPNSISMVFGFKPLSSYTIHHFMGSWTNNPKKKTGFSYRAGHFLSGLLRNLLGTEKHARMRNKKS